ncbi:hypothetical protein V9K67_18880 [Paraflavisolibacter sp. H34]|uniref:hypothetical protein n=1 Tax=Huijunlia imazamoxiresistens TaxID=3127457 RepID=UPI0030185FB2
MKSFSLLIFLLAAVPGRSQTTSLPSWFTAAFRNKALNRKYDLHPYLKPSFLQADFNGDGTRDIAVPVMVKGTKKKGVLLVHGKTTEYFLFGAGTDFGTGSDDYYWVDQWGIYSHKTAFETQFNKDDEITGVKEHKLTRPGILVEAYEDGASIGGGIIYWNGKKYIWIHQGE